ncbi:MAG: C40 family peptidase [Saprospiraceae bacterium]
MSTNWKAGIMGVWLLLGATSCSHIQEMLRCSPEVEVSAAEAQLRKNIVSYALDYQGTRYKYAGRSPQTGFDCSGFVHYVFQAFNHDLPPVSRAQETEGRKIDVGDTQAGDLLFFRKSKAGQVFHVALVVKNTNEGITVVHSTTSRGVVMENISQSSYWKNKITTACDVLRSR